MTTFVTVLRRAVENLEDNSEQERAAIYDRARSALRAQFHHAEPPLSQDELDRQVAELDEAIVQIEADFANGGYLPDEEAAARIMAEEPAQDDWQEADVAAEAASLSDSHASFRSAIAETAALGVAASQAAQAARETYGAFDYSASEPSADEDGVGIADHIGRGSEEDAVRQPHPDAAEEVAAAFAQNDASHPASEARYAGSPADAFDDDYDGGGRGVSVATWAIVFLMIAGIAGAAFWQRDALSEVALSLGGGETEVAEASEEAKIDERVPSAAIQPEEAVAAAPPQTERAAAAPAAQASLPQEAARIAQALLVEEAADNSLSSLGGTVDWALLDDPEAPPEASKVIRATVQVPDKNITLTMAIRRNTDPDLPASHTVELLFDLPRNFENGGIAGVAGLVMKATPQSSGQPLIGAVVPVTEEFYLLGLSESDFDRSRNIDELRRRSFIDIPIAYSDQSRAILSLAKGESGNDVFSQAFEAWGH